eukprot:403358383
MIFDIQPNPGQQPQFDLNGNQSMNIVIQDNDEVYDDIIHHQNQNLVLDGQRESNENHQGEQENLLERDFQSLFLDNNELDIGQDSQLSNNESSFNSDIENQNLSINEQEIIEIDDEILSNIDELIKQDPEKYKKYLSVFKPWMNKAEKLINAKKTQKNSKTIALGAAGFYKFLGAKVIIDECKSLASKMNPILETLDQTADIAQKLETVIGPVSENYLKATQGIIEKMSNQPNILSKVVTLQDVLKHSVIASGGALNCSYQVLKESLQTSWVIPAFIFIGEVALLTWQRFVSKSIDTQTFQNRVKASFLSNFAGFISGSFGAFIGSLIGDLLAPGIGGLVGSLLVGLFASIRSQKLVDMYFDSHSYSVEEYEKQVVTEAEKLESFKLSCEALNILPSDSSAKIKKQARKLYRKYHPQQNQNINPQDLDFCQSMLVKVRLAFIFVEQYRMEKGTWQ